VVILYVPAVSKDVVSLAVALFGVIGTHVGHVVGGRAALQSRLSDVHPAGTAEGGSDSRRGVKSES
jgi:hypothetical protein